MGQVMGQGTNPIMPNLLKCVCTKQRLYLILRSGVLKFGKSLIFTLKNFTQKFSKLILNYPNFLLNVLPARVKVIEAISNKGITFAITSSIPIPFKNSPLDKTIKNLTGFK